MDDLGERPPRIFATNAVQMLRTVQAGTLALSQMADQKASILMGASFVVFSISVSRAVSGGISISIGVLAFFAFASSLCAVLAILPSIGATPRADPARANPLFFGHFAARDEVDWTEEMLAGLESEEAMFRMMLRDIHQNGQVLAARKYRYLTIACRIFIAGLCLTIATFLVERFYLGA